MKDPLHIASLLPAATEWVVAFGAEENLVARSHLCDCPPQVASLPAVTRSLIDSRMMGSAAIDHTVRELIADGQSPNAIDVERLSLLRPDVILAQDDCRACAPFAPDLGEWLDEEAVHVFTFAPATLKQVMDGAIRLGLTIGRMEEAMRWIASAEKRLALLRERLGLSRRMDERGLPSVVCLEWLDPLMAAGHWTPDVICMAGGRVLLGESGQRARTVTWADVTQADPDVLVLAPCGFTVEQTLAELPELTNQPGWRALRAVRGNQVFVIDGASYLNRPGPRLYRSIEVMAAALHAGRGLTDAFAIHPWELQHAKLAASTIT